MEYELIVLDEASKLLQHVLDTVDPSEKKIMLMENRNKLWTFQDYHPHRVIDIPSKYFRSIEAYKRAKSFGTLHEDKIRLGQLSALQQDERMNKLLLNRESFIFMLYLYTELEALLFYYRGTKKRFDQFETSAPGELRSIIEKVSRGKAIVKGYEVKNQQLIEEIARVSPKQKENIYFEDGEFAKLHPGMKMLYQKYQIDRAEYHADVANGELNPYQDALIDCTKTVCRGAVQVGTAIGKAAFSAANSYLSEKQKTEGGKRKTKRRKQRKHLTRMR